MVRLGAVFVALCIVVIAASAGAGAYLYVRLPLAEASVLALAVLTALSLYALISLRLRDRLEIGDRMADLSRVTADLAQRVGELGRRTAAVERKLDAMPMATPVSDTIAVELGELGSLMKQLAEAVAAHDLALKQQAVGVAAPPVGDIWSAPPEPSPPAPPRNSAAIPAAAAPHHPENAAMIEAVRRAVDAGRIELHLQPTVTLPQRKVRYYEALSRMRGEDGELLAAADFIGAAAAGGLIGKIDNLALFRAVQVARHLMTKHRDVGIFCNIAGTTLSDSAVFAQLLDFVDANKAVASSLVFEFPQIAVRAFGPSSLQNLAKLAQRGLRFSVDQVTDLGFEPRVLSACGFRFVKVRAALLLDNASAAATDIHPADLSDLLSRFGIDLIVERIEQESSVPDLLDFGVRYGQGFLFSPPRPVRQEAFAASAELAGGLARQETAGDDTRPPRAAAWPDPTARPVPRRSALGQLARGTFKTA